MTTRMWSQTPTSSIAVQVGEEPGAFGRPRRLHLVVPVGMPRGLIGSPGCAAR